LGCAILANGQTGFEPSDRGGEEYYSILDLTDVRSDRWIRLGMCGFGKSSDGL